MKEFIPITAKVFKIHCLWKDFFFLLKTCWAHNSSSSFAHLLNELSSAWDTPPNRVCLLQCWSSGEKRMQLYSQSYTENFRHRLVFVFLSRNSAFKGTISHLTYNTAHLCKTQALTLFCAPVSQAVLKHRWSVLYLLLSLSEDPRKPSSRVSHVHTHTNTQYTSF